MGTTEASTVDEMIRHFAAHRKAGDRVPDDYYESLIECHYLEEEFLSNPAGRESEAEDLLPHDLHESHIETQYFEDEIVGSFSLSRFDETAKVSVSRTTAGDRLLCHCCALNGERLVECFSTKQMMQHLDLHRSRGTPVPKLVYEMLQLARSLTERGIENYFAERLMKRPSEPKWEPLTCFLSCSKLRTVEMPSRSFALCW